MVKKKKKKVLKKKTAKKTKPKLGKKKPKVGMKKKAKSTASRLKKKGAPENKMQVLGETAGKAIEENFLPVEDTEQVVTDDTYEAPVDEAVSFNGQDEG